MIKSIIKLFKKYKMSIYIALIITIIGTFGIVFFNMISNKEVMKKFENDSYTLQYDNTWSLKTKTNNSLVLKNSSNAKISIETINLKDEIRYSSVDDLIDEIIYSVEKQNTNYKLLSMKDTVISKYEYKGYKLLYENGSSQVMITVYKKSDKLIMINYESNNEYFDILLDSAQNIIYNFNTKEKKYNLSNELSLDTNEISYSEDKELDSKLGLNKSYEIANSNYYVKYSIPNNFQLNDFDSNYNYFNLRDLNGKEITIYTSIYNSNIFEWLDRDSRVNIYNDYEWYKNDEDYSGFEETLTKLEGNIDTYLYKNSYYYDKAITYDKDMNLQEIKRKNENARLIYALNKNHVLIITIETRGASITKKLLDSIIIEEIKNYSSYVTSTKSGNMLVSELKRYTSYDKNKIAQVIIKIPDKYKEIQKYNNIHLERIFGLNYDEDNYIYDYKIRYELTPTFSKIDSEIDIINSSFKKTYGEYNYLKQSNNITLNNHSFNVYDGGYTQLGGVMFTSVNRFEYYTKEKVLFYKLTNGGYLVIEISANGKDITDDILNDVTNFDIKEIDV